MRKVWLCAAAAATVAVLTACGAEDSGNNGQGAASSAAESPAQQDGAAEEPAEDQADATDHVKIVKSGFRDHDVWGPDAYVVEYEITNKGNDAADYFVQLEFLDVDGDRLGTTGVTADKLGAGKSKKADTAPLDAEIENGEMTDIKSVKVVEVQRTKPAA